MIKYFQYLKRLIKLVLAYSLYYSGILLLIKKITLKNKIIILTYHRVLPYELRSRSYSHSAIMVDPVNFERQLNFIKRHFQVINSNSLTELIDKQLRPENPLCLITFDDGWLDNHMYAYPILNKLSLSALIFIATDYINSNKLFWQEAMGHGFKQLIDMNSHDSIEFLKKHDMNRIVDVDHELQIEIIRNYIRELKTLPYNQLDNIMKEITTIVGKINYGDYDKYLNWQQVKEMYNNGIEFGSHARSHKILTRLDDQSVYNELLQSKHIIEEVISDKVDTIAYPNGNYNDRIGELTKKSGYKLGFGTKHGYVMSNDDKFNLKRININDTTSTNDPIMLATILGIF